MIISNVPRNRELGPTFEINGELMRYTIFALFAKIPQPVLWFDNNNTAVDLVECEEEA